MRCIVTGTVNMFAVFMRFNPNLPGIPTEQCFFGVPSNLTLF
jgi:hypothetical protein